MKRETNRRKNLPLLVLAPVLLVVVVALPLILVLRASGVIDSAPWGSGSEPAPFVLDLAKLGYLDAADVPGAHVDGSRALAGDSGEDAPSPVRILVLDVRTKRPVPDALVQYRVGENDAPSEGVTDEQGLVATECTVAPKGLTIDVLHRDYASRPFRQDGRQRITLYLTPRVELAGLVVDGESGQAVGAAQVIHSGRMVRTQSDGSFRFDELVMNPYYNDRVAVIAAGYLPANFAIDPRAENARIEVRWELSRGILLRGRVVDHQTEAPVAGASVSPGRGKTDADGLFEVRASHAVEFLEVRKAGYGRTTANLEGEQVIEIRLPRLATVRGTVSDSTGEPIRYAWVELRPNERLESGASVLGPLQVPDASWPGDRQGLSGPLHDLSAETDETGSYEIVCPPWLNDFPFVVEALGREEFVELVSRGPAPGEALYLNVALPASRGGTVRGWVRVNGQAHDGVVQWTSGERTGWVEAWREEPFCVPGVAGRVRLEAFPFLSEPTPLPAEVLPERIAELVVTEGENVEVYFDLKYDLALLSGRVVDTGGHPVPDASLEAHLAGAVVAEARSDPEGRFELRVPRIAQTVAVSASELFHSVRVDSVAVDAREIELVLPEQGCLRLRALDAASGAPLSSYGLRWIGTDGGRDVNPGSLRPDPEGWTDLKLPAGESDLLVFARSRSLLPRLLRGIDVPSGDVLTLEVELQPALTAELRCTGGVRPHGVSIWLLEPEAVEHLRRDDHGDWELGPGADPAIPLAARAVRWKGDVGLVEGLEPGRYQIVSEPGVPDALPVRILVAPDARTFDVTWKGD